LHSVAARTQFTYVDEAQRQLALYGAASAILFGGLYHALPLITGKAWFSQRLVRTHLLLAVAGILLLVGSLCAAGLVQGRDLLDPQVQFADMFEHTRPWLVASTLARAMLLLGNAALLANFCLTARRAADSARPAPLTSSAAAEAPGP